MQGLPAYAGDSPPRVPEPPVIKFRCVQCQKKIGVSDAAAGKRAKCPGCEAVMRVPQPAPVPVAVREREPDFQLAEDPVEPRRERRRVAQPRNAAADHTVAGQVLNTPAPGAPEPEARLERRARADAMDSLAGLAALGEADGERLMSFGSGMGPSPRARSRGRQETRNRVPMAIRPACGTCGAETPASARFCTSCGAGLGAPVLPVDAAGGMIPLPDTRAARPGGWRNGFFGWLLGAR